MSYVNKSLYQFISPQTGIADVRRHIKSLDDIFSSSEFVLLNSDDITSQKLVKSFRLSSLNYGVLGIDKDEEGKTFLTSQGLKYTEILYGGKHGIISPSTILTDIRIDVSYAKESVYRLSQATVILKKPDIAFRGAIALSDVAGSTGGLLKVLTGGDLKIATSGTDYPSIADMEWIKADVKVVQEEATAAQATAGSALTLATTAQASSGKALYDAAAAQATANNAINSISDISMASLWLANSSAALPQGIALNDLLIGEGDLILVDDFGLPHKSTIEINSALQKITLKEILLKDDFGGYMGFRSNINLKNIVYQFPPNDGEDGQVLTSKKNGVLEWSNKLPTSLKENAIWIGNALNEPKEQRLMEIPGGSGRPFVVNTLGYPKLSGITLPDSPLGVGIVKSNLDGSLGLATEDADYATKSTLEQIKTQTEAYKTQAQTSAQQASLSATTAEASAGAAAGSAGSAAGSATAAGFSAFQASLSATGAGISAGAAGGAAASASSSASSASNYKDAAYQSEVKAKASEIKAEEFANTYKNIGFVIDMPNSSLPNAQALSQLINGVAKVNLGRIEIAQEGVDYSVPQDVQLAVWTTATRPFNPKAGMIGLNTRIQ